MDRDQRFYEMYGDTYRELIRYVYNRCKDKDLAEDIVQETYSEALIQFDKLQDHENLKGWLFKTASYKASNYIKKQKKEEVGLDLVGEPGDCEAQYDAIEWKVALAGMVGEQNAEIFWAYHVLGYTGSEIAAHYGIKESCLKVRVYRIKKKIQEQMLQD